MILLLKPFENNFDYSLIYYSAIEVIFLQNGSKQIIRLLLLFLVIGGKNLGQPNT